MSIYAAYLYDSVMLYARTLDLLLRDRANGRELTGEMIDEVAYNGTLIIETLVKNITYQSKYKLKIHLKLIGMVIIYCITINILHNDAISL